MILFNKHQMNFNPNEKTSIHSLNEKKKKLIWQNIFVLDYHWVIILFYFKSDILHVFFFFSFEFVRSISVNWKDF